MWATTNPTDRRRGSLLTDTRSTTTFLVLLWSAWGCGRSPLAIPSTSSVDADAAPPAHTTGTPDARADLPSIGFADTARTPNDDSRTTPADAAREAPPDRAVRPPADAASAADSDTAPALPPDTAPPRRRAWRGPEPIEDFYLLSFNAEAVMDGAGNVFAAWRQYERVPFRSEGVAANRYDRSAGAWGTASFIDSGKDSATMPTLAVDGAGNALVAWEEVTGLNSADVYGARFDVTRGSWSLPEFVADPDSNGALEPAVALGAAGDGLVAWLQSNPWHGLHTARFVGGSWQPASELLRQGSSNPGYPRLAADDAGNATLVWVELEGDDQGLHLRRMDAGTGVWGEDIVLSTEKCYSPILALAPAGNAAVTWLEPDSTQRSPHGAHANARNGSWEEFLPQMSPASFFYPSIAVADGAAVLVWRQGEGEELAEVFASLRAGDGVWQSPVLLGRDAGIYTVPRAAFAGNGTVIATWYQSPQESAHVVGARYDPESNTWSEPVVLDDGAGSAQNPIVAANDAGLAVVLWESKGPDFSSHLWANRWE